MENLLFLSVPKLKHIRVILEMGKWILEHYNLKSQAADQIDRLQSETLIFIFFLQSFFFLF